MRPQREIPPEWADRMIALGFHHNGKPSARRMADEAGVAVGAALRVIYRENWGESTVIALGRVLRDEAFVSQWVGAPQGVAYEPPPSSRLLTPKQRLLVDELIRELSERGQSWGAGTTSGPEDGDELARRRQQPDDPADLVNRYAADHQPGPTGYQQAIEDQEQAGQENQDEGE